MSDTFFNQCCTDHTGCSGNNDSFHCISPFVSVNIFSSSSSLLRKGYISSSDADTIRKFFCRGFWFCFLIFCHKHLAHRCPGFLQNLMKCFRKFFCSMHCPIRKSICRYDLGQIRETQISTLCSNSHQRWFKITLLCLSDRMITLVIDHK